MEHNRYMIIHENGNISFQKVVVVNGEIEVTGYAEYDENTQTELDFAQECQKRFDNEHPEWAGVLTWTMICEDDLTEELEVIRTRQKMEAI